MILIIKSNIFLSFEMVIYAKKEGVWIGYLKLFWKLKTLINWIK